MTRLNLWQLIKSCVLNTWAQDDGNTLKEAEASFLLVKVFKGDGNFSSSKWTLFKPPFHMKNLQQEDEFLFYSQTGKHSKEEGT